MHGGKTAPEAGPVVHSHPVEAVQASGGDLLGRQPSGVFLAQMRRPWRSPGTCWGGLLPSAGVETIVDPQLGEWID